MSEGRLYTLSGIDGTGKSTQAALLLDALCARGLRCASLADFTLGPSGLDSAAPASVDSADDWRAYRVQLAPYDALFSSFCPRFERTAALIERLKGSQLLDDVEAAVAGSVARDSTVWFEQVIAPLLNEGKIVVLDRYHYDEVAYAQGVGVYTSRPASTKCPVR